MSINPFAEFYPSTTPGPRPRPAGQFKVVRVADLMVNRENRPAMGFDRRPFIKSA